MAPIPKPGTPFQFAISHVVDPSGRPNIVEPQAGKKNDGWNFEEQPPRNYENWIHHTATEWFAYLEAMTDAGQRAASMLVAAEDSADVWKQCADYVVGAGADAAVQINLAIANLPSGVGGKVLLAEGTYILKTAITANKAHLWIQGCGTQTILAIATAAAISAGINVTANHFRMSDLLIMSDSGGAGALYANGVRINGCASFVLDRLVVWSLFGGPTTYGPVVPKGVAFHVLNGSGVISNCTVMHATTAPLASSEAVLVEAGRVHIANCRFEAITFGGTNIPTGCIYAQAGAAVQVVNCYMDRATYGIQLASAEPCIVHGCEVRYTTSHGIQLDGITSHCHIGLANIIRDSGGAGVNVEATAGNNEINGNIIYDPAGDGVQVAGDYNTVEGNRIYSAGGTGVDVAVGADGNAVNGNKIYSATVNGIELSGLDCQAHENLIDGAVVGIAASGNGSDIQGNRIYRTSGDGIYLVGVTNGKANGNKIHLPSGYGIRLGAATVAGQCRGNQVTYSTLHGIMLENADNNDVSGNEVDNTAIAASSIFIDPNSSGNKVSENSLRATAVTALIGINHDGDSQRENLITGNYILGGATTEMRIQQAGGAPPANVRWLPQNHAGIDVLNCNFMNPASITYV